MAGIYAKTVDVTFFAVVCFLKVLKRASPFLFPLKKSNQKKLSAAPCSMKGCVEAGAVVAEQAKADLGRASLGLANYFF
jgi:hypothetical protein